jgi:hypothetical protein
LLIETAASYRRQPFYIRSVGQEVHGLGDAPNKLLNHTPSDG